MRRLGRLGSAALVGPAVLLIAACGHQTLAPAASSTPTAGQVTAPGTATPAISSASGGSSNDGVSDNQINQIDNQINQINNEIGQADGGLSTSEGDPAS
jgi:hypothetical protein